MSRFIRQHTSEKPPYLWAALTAAIVFAIYLATLAPTTAFWDTSEYIAAAKVLGIPHPPGNPLFMILAHGSDCSRWRLRMPCGSISSRP